MNLPLFIARRMYSGSNTKKLASRPAVLIAMLGIAIGLVVMIVTVSVILGFKKEVKEKIVGFGQHIQVLDQSASLSYEMNPIVVSDSLMVSLYNNKTIEHVQRFSTKGGMIKTNVQFQGMVLKGIGPEYDTRFLKDCLVEGDFPVFSDSASSNRVVISQVLAQKMGLRTGDKVDTYYIGKTVRARKLEIVGIYRTHFSDFDNLFVFTDICLVNRLNYWSEEQVSGLEISIKDYNQLAQVTDSLSTRLRLFGQANGQKYTVKSIEDLYPSIFAWLGVLDMNIWIILVLMLGVAGFTMISGLLIIIIERTQMIGLLKSLGATNLTIRKSFLWFSAFLIGKGILIGNIVGLAFYFVQKAFGIFTLDPETYYMDKVPVSFNLWIYILLNIGTLLASVLMLIGPSFLITRIHPATSMRYE